jgi:hypothetical protein
MVTPPSDTDEVRHRQRGSNRAFCDTSAAAEHQVPENTIKVIIFDLLDYEIRRFARDVLPALKAHRVDRVPTVEEIEA